MIEGKENKLIKLDSFILKQKRNLKSINNKILNNPGKQNNILKSIKKLILSNIENAKSKQKQINKDVATWRKEES